MATPTRHINPNYQRFTPKTYTPEACIKGLGKDIKILSFLISKAESPRSADKQLLDTILSQARPDTQAQVVPNTQPIPICNSQQQTNKTQPKARKIAITGSPGVGKSTFLNAYCSHLLEQGYKVAILPVDPSSHASKGSILGDKTRMDDLVGRANIYIKPMASSLALGGVAPSTRTAIDLCELAGYEYIFVETVGVGQSEYAVRHLVDMFILLLQPGGGDELQGIKRGIIEMADLLIVTKADGDLRPAAHQSLRGYKNALQLLWPNAYAWKAKATLYSSVDHRYRQDLEEKINAYYTHMAQQSRLAQLRADQALHYFHAGTTQVMLDYMRQHGNLSDDIKVIEQQLLSEKIYPFQALLRLEHKLNERE